MGILDDLVATLPRVAGAALRGLRREVVALVVTSALALASLLWLLVVASADEDVAPLLGVAALLTHPVLAAGLAQVGLLASRGGVLGVGTLFACFWPPGRWLVNVLVAGLVLAVVGLGTVFLVLPGLVLLARLGFAVFFVNSEGLGPVAALRESWVLTRGRTLRLLLLVLLSAGMLGAGAVLYLVGAIPVLAMLIVGWGATFDLLREEQAAG